MDKGRVCPLQQIKKQKQGKDAFINDLHAGGTGTGKARDGGGGSLPCYK